VLTISRATVDQVALVHRLLTEAAGWLADLDIDQWPHPFPEHIVRRTIQDTYLAWQADELVGSVAIYWDDSTFWGAQPPDAGYVHRLVVADSHRGQGLGAGILDWAGEHIAVQGRRWLRLDCGAVNARLRAFYEHQRFQHVRDVEVSVSGAGSAGEFWRASLYQRPASP
jgi:GNAT superfamily N-acetyltransferase